MMDNPTFSLKKRSSFAESLLRFYLQSRSIPPSWLDSPLQNDRLVAQHVGLTSRNNNIESTIQKALYYHGFNKKPGKPQTVKNTFILPHQTLGPTQVKELYKRLKQTVENSKQGIELTITPEQFEQIRPSIKQLMYFHGNQTLTGAPYFHGGLEHIDFFQWGNLMGIIKFVESPEEHTIKANLLVYFEDLEERTLEEAFNEYVQIHPQLVEAVTAKPIIQPQPLILPEAQKIQTPSIAVPRLTLTPFIINPNGVPPK